MLCLKNILIHFGLKCYQFIFVIILILYFWFFTNEKHKNPIQLCSDNQNSIDINLQKLMISGSKIDHAKILLISEARSGSTFLGDLLHYAIESSYYSFEPLVGAKRNPYEYKKIIDNIFDCQFDSNSYLKPMYWKIQYLKWNRLLMKIVGFDQYENDDIHLFNKTIHQIICQSSSAIIIKTIRFTLKNLSSLILSKSINNMKIIFLVRDPRAVMSSRYKLSWCLHNENCTDSRVLCDRIQANIESLKMIKNSMKNISIILLRYEDLIGDIWKSTNSLFKFLEIVPNPSLDQWIRKHTLANDFLLNPHSTYRNIKSQQTIGWRENLSYEDLLDIQYDCSDVMNELGYRLTNYRSIKSKFQTIFEVVSFDFPLKIYSL
ncbi:carbohydrate sulfotransferase 1-like [Dermatophagoides pteronyssinus]|uniref:carbohydrate sulfotransferase 1-like n=1 Tax=Dermatophagoides pteronyssinus TaxID=6956 RepID=UPI003F6631BB